MILFIRQPPGLIITVNPYISPLLRGQTYRTVVCTPSPRNLLYSARDDNCKTKRDQKTQPYFSPKIEYRK